MHSLQFIVWLNISKYLKQEQMSKPKEFIIFTHLTSDSHAAVKNWLLGRKQKQINGFVFFEEQSKMHDFL